MSATPSFNTLIQIAGQSVAFANEATDWFFDSENQKHGFRISDDSHRNIDPRSPLSVSVNGVVTVPDYVDYPTGTVWFDNYVGTASQMAVVVSGSSFSPVGIGGSKSYSLEIGGEILDTSELAIDNSPVGFKERAYGLLDVTASIDGFHKSTAAETSYRDQKMNREIVILRIYAGTATTAGNDDSATYYVGYFTMDTLGWSGDVGELEGKSLSFSLARFAEATSKSLNHFAFISQHTSDVFEIPSDYNFTVQLFDPADSGIISLSDVDLTDDSSRDIVFDYRSLFFTGESSDFLVIATPTELEFAAGNEIDAVSVRPESSGRGQLEESAGELRVRFDSDSWNAESPLSIDVTHQAS